MRLKRDSKAVFYYWKRVMFYASLFIHSPAAASNYFRYILGRRKIRVAHSPLLVNFYITDKCNFDCRMCLRRERKYAASVNLRKDMDLPRFSELLNKLDKCIYVQFAGLGEPLMNKEVFGMMELAKRRKKGIILYTNAAFLDESAAAKLCDLGVHRVNISLYGADHDEFCSTTSSDRDRYYSVLSNIERLVRIKSMKCPELRVALLYICSRRNIGNCRKIIDIGNSLLVDEIHFNNFNRQPFDNLSAGDEYLFDDDPDIVRKVRDIKRQRSFAAIYLPAILSRKKFKRKCLSYYKYINLDYEGNVAGCCKFCYPAREQGNVFLDKDVFNTEHFLRMRAVFADKHSELPHNCKFCQEMF